MYITITMPKVVMNIACRVRRVFPQRAFRFHLHRLQSGFDFVVLQAFAF